MSSRIYFDTAPIIYFLDKSPLYYTKMRDFIFRNINDESQFYTSVLIDMEYLVFPYKNADFQKVNQYKAFIKDLNFKQIDISSEICDFAAKLRAEYDFLKQMDALHLSCCIYFDCDFFVTNDRQLLKVTEIKPLFVDDFKDDVL